MAALVARLYADYFFGAISKAVTSCNFASSTNRLLMLSSMRTSTSEIGFRARASTFSTVRAHSLLPAKATLQQAAS